MNLHHSFKGLTSSCLPIQVLIKRRETKFILHTQTIPGGFALLAVLLCTASVLTLHTPPTLSKALVTTPFTVRTWQRVSSIHAVCCRLMDSLPCAATHSTTLIECISPTLIRSDRWRVESPTRVETMTRCPPCNIRLIIDSTLESTRCLFLQFSSNGTRE